jgi:ribonuclease J
VDKNKFLGFNSIVCPFDYIIENAHRVQGLIITHAHEDHIGGIPFLLKEVSIPKIYVPKFTKAIIENKLREHKDLKPFSFEFFKDDTIIRSKHFVIDFFRVCHSVPDAFGICFQTPTGNIVTTGDFRFDFLTKGDESDIAKMAEVGKRDIDILLCESTNAQTPGFSMSEKYIIDELRREIKICKGRIFVSLFASNINRVEEIIEIAINNNRKIILGGRSMVNNVGVTLKLGMLNLSRNEFLEMKDANNYPDNELLFLTTGSQGEEMAALNQIASGNNNWVKFKPTDTIIFSSNPIPGNYENVENLINKLYHNGVKINVSDSEKKIHSSGHATQTELQLLIKLINPRYIIPIHGEFKMLNALKRSGEYLGMHDDHLLIVVNGQKVRLAPGHKAEVTDDFVEMYDNFVDGDKINKDIDNLLKYRENLSSDGIISATLMINKQTKKLTQLPIFVIRGSFHSMSSSDLINKISYAVKEAVENLMNSNPSYNDQDIKKIVASTVDFHI